ncbi:CinA family protein [Alteromonas sp. 1_MG-2023]|uniref:CinA family protein n=1 Tax=Alteromonas sp. 1_MG-2023 TaxID=3062669 RepID=UPI0026E235E8|nr:CinA family protein [Alteromonas sp. 1_MG-2023]MDO6565501.1 CinA family protein [Alteromonas sp. 1_MG-2023]
MVSDNTTEMVTALGNALRRKGWTVSSAESCTGGGIAFAFTSIAGSSDWFNQSWVTYSNDAKMRELAVKPETLNAHGAVSMQTVEEMAAGVKHKSGANVVVTVSGIAGPGGGSDEKPVGTVWFGFICGEKTENIKQVFAGDREAVRLHAIEFAITHLLAMLAD